MLNFLNHKKLEPFIENKHLHFNNICNISTTLLQHEKWLQIQGVMETFYYTGQWKKKHY